MANLQLLLETCSSFSCGDTYNFMLGCLNNHWSESFIREQKYLNYDPADFQGPHSGRCGIFSLENPEQITVLFINQTEVIPSPLNQFIAQLKEITMKNGYMGMELGDHCWLVLCEHEKFFIIDSYVHAGEAQNRQYDRRLGKRPFDFAQFEQLLRNPSLSQWNQLFNNHSSAIETNTAGMFSDFSVSY
jgi:hypothetical protein